MDTNRVQRKIFDNDLVMVLYSCFAIIYHPESRGHGSIMPKGGQSLIDVKKSDIKKPYLEQDEDFNEYR